METDGKNDFIKTEIESENKNNSPSKRIETISGWWIALGAAVSIGSDYFSIKPIGYRGELVYSFGMFLLLICIVLSLVYSKQNKSSEITGESKPEPACIPGLLHLILAAVLFISGWLFGDFIVIFSRRFI